ncbi:ABC-F family ATP-binding cassette domain-containing protein [Tenacibaculum finnmarkense genomovar finnmarkense]|uniref:Probable ATP-binding protein YbiT n=1 Tax=Tenacibaculum finnmarkense genomovar finnmarkense TaxID=1458503 RepID=A0AAP1RDY7_9FLAO|nr:ABC-F family ATP-binding cassette domain-containing protein [Tenacibaculum finnmarkense]MBE7651907.1 ATP-binding cassette domain-containing protein [Tenacibaculum finnmarkense genomovar finnmarkense]MBE7659131.1 ATP-binding cassette domain-containing protein [Tenacibaculum finnmarkense genomovar finnmarkense]MBE7694378.1 ATP-binding cassette domain-containing protein [Tenacibaculum finnmarkense genomovar finnmarkense]MCD8401846.1 ABC-F family ATP-binding cassette domain-containing protein [T
MLNVHNLSVSFMGTDLFSGITFKLNKGDRIGLIGKNGAGKSTLLKVLSKDIETSGGTMAFDKDIRMGFLRQDIDFVEGRTILEEAYQAFVEIKEIEVKLDEINEQLATRTDYESEEYSQLIIDLTDLTERYELLGGYNYQGDTEKILQGLGFQREDFDKLTSTFSGGWRMRIELAKLLLQDNDILLLDEPTNHLDIESIIWLENFLRSYSGAIVLVSHDKMFLDNVTNRTIEISLGQIYDYKKPYSQFLVLRAEIKEKQLQAQKNQEKEIKQKQHLINKFKAKASKASMAQSLMKQLDKVQLIEVDGDDNAAMNVKFAISKEPGRIIVEADSLCKSYGDKHVLQDVDLMIERNSKIAFVGQNGQGKSTLAKMMVGEIPFEGNLKLGHNVEIGYFAQNQSEELPPEKTVLEIMEDAASDTNRMRVRDMLGSFLFGGDAVDKKAKVLSGGERNRLALCKLLLSPFNVLVMDEPTNHLDIASKTVLKTALKNFEGTLIVVSHDRDFLQGLTSTVYGFKDKVIKEYLGDIDYFLEQHKMENLREAEKRTVVKVEKPTAKKEAHQLSREQEKELKKLKNKLSKTETEIADLETEIAKIDLELANNYDEVSARPNFFEKYKAKKASLDTLMANWEKIEEQVSNF